MLYFLARYSKCLSLLTYRYLTLLSTLAHTFELITSLISKIYYINFLLFKQEKVSRIYILG
ncbi:hypothetical protein VPHD249_0085 [Vibrio phage D249]